MGKYDGQACPAIVFSHIVFLHGGGLKKSNCLPANAVFKTNIPLEGRVLSRSESTIFRRTVQNFQNKHFATQDKHLGFLFGVWLPCGFQTNFFLFKLNNMRNHNRTPKLMFPLVTNMIPYSCGIFHIKGEVEEG